MICRTKGLTPPFFMSYHVRKVKTGSKATAVQVVKYVNRKRIVVKHFGSAHNKEQESILWDNASKWISQQSKQMTFFPEDEGFISLEQFEYLGFQYTFLYDTLYKLQSRLGYTCFGNKLLNDLVTIRIIEPASKLRSVELLETYFNIKHRRRTLYDILPKLLKLKNKIEELTINFAVKEFDFDFAIVFYDVTTLYFVRRTPSEKHSKQTIFVKKDSLKTINLINHRFSLAWLLIKKVSL